MTFITNQILKWYNKNKRDLPWRKTSDPYKIWLSEIILQQTRVGQGTDYYYRFVRDFPNIHLLAKAKEEKVIKLWQGLGYYSRVRNLHAAAKEIVQKHKGLIPDNYDDLIKLKGIGDYTASAILSIAFNKSYPVVDGNVIRVVTRIFGIARPVNKSPVLKQIKSKVKELMPVKQPGNFNQAIMEFGALQCVPQNPHCNACCLKSICIAFRKKTVNKIPVKTTIVTIKTRYLNYLLINYRIKNAKYYYIRKRQFNDIWKNMYDLPCIETIEKVSYKRLMGNNKLGKIFGSSKYVLKNKSKIYTHKLSHQILYAVFYVVEIPESLKNPPSSYKIINASQFHIFPVSRLLEKYFMDQKLIQ